MKHRPALAACSIALACALLTTRAAAAEKPVVTVNGLAIPQAMADMYLAQANAHGMPDDATTKAKIRDDIIDNALLFQAAQKAGTDRKPEVASAVETRTRLLLAEVEATRQSMIARAFAEDYLRQHPVSDADLKASYDAYRSQGGNTEYKLRHILVKDEASARALVAKLDKGTRFEDLASASIDAGSRAQGGDLGWNSPARFVPAFGEALKKLAKGQYTHTPVKTAFGYHLIKVDDTRPLAVPSFEAMKPMLRQDAERAAIARLVAGLRAKADIR